VVCIYKTPQSSKHLCEGGLHQDEGKTRTAGYVQLYMIYM